MNYKIVNKALATYLFEQGYNPTFTTQDGNRVYVFEVPEDGMPKLKRLIDEYHRGITRTKG